MRSGFERVAFGTLMVLGVLAIAGTAQAQSTMALLPAGVNFDAAAATAAPAPTANTLPVFVYQARPNVNFQAQNQGQLASEDDQGIGVGVLGMLTRASVDADDASEFFDLKARTGAGVGLWVGGNRNGRVGFVGEFIYLVRKSAIEEADQEFKASVFEIPAVFHVNVGSRSRNSIGGYIVVGPVFSFLLNQQFRDGDGDWQDIDDDEKFKGADIGIIGGAGIEFFRIGIEGRGNWGLRNISSEGDVGKTKTFTFELLGKFAFN